MNMLIVVAVYQFIMSETVLNGYCCNCL